jgi:hypothetical protein
MRCRPLPLLLLALFALAFAPAPLARRGPGIDYQKLADALPWLAPDGEPKTTLESGGGLYRAEFHPHSSGCAVAAYVPKGERLWRSELKGLGPVDHSKYFNAVRVEAVGRDALAVYGKETSGRYVEIVSLQTGRTLGHKVFAK